ncbi:hypothetical protein [Synechococcus sp. CC9605]|uniref:hypothetical protein n=1 Tax=Synechococcus sp. (strain CC9605) TaxID=110662 RepID=UPI00059DFC94|nr:hypothetical protein [Synechococcus sp. CC9605]
MSSKRARLDMLVAECRPSFVEAARKLQEKESWDFNCPVVVMDGRSDAVKVSVIGVGSVANVVPASAAIDSPEVREWLAIATEKGAEVAFAEMFDGPEDRAERFSEAYDRLREERESGIKGLWSAGDLAGFVSKSRAAYPKALGAIAVLPGEGEQSHHVLTFESEVESLLR